MMNKEIQVMEYSTRLRDEEMVLKTCSVIC